MENLLIVVHGKIKCNISVWSITTLKYDHIFTKCKAIKRIQFYLLYCVPKTIDKCKDLKKHLTHNLIRSHYQICTKNSVKFMWIKYEFNFSDTTYEVKIDQIIWVVGLTLFAGTLSKISSLKKRTTIFKHFNQIKMISYNWNQQY